MRSRPLSGRRHGGSEPPEFLIDRSLGRVALPSALREVGLVVHTLADLYGEQASQEVEDHQWIAVAAENDWVVLCKDDRIRRRPAERDALSVGQVRAFCLTNANLSPNPTVANTVTVKYNASVCVSCWLKLPGPRRL